jgi:hypothetical protein
VISVHTVFACKYLDISAQYPLEGKLSQAFPMCLYMAQMGPSQQTIGKNPPEEKTTLGGGGGGEAHKQHFGIFTAQIISSDRE